MESIKNDNFVLTQFRPVDIMIIVAYVQIFV